MIVFANPRATRPKNRRFPLSVMSLGAVLPEWEKWTILDGNRPGVDLASDLRAFVRSRDGTPDAVTLVAMTVMPGPQLVDAVSASRAFKAEFPHVPLVWGGYFPSLYPNPVVRAPYVDWAVRGQGEETFLQLLSALREGRDPKGVAGLAFADDGTEWIAPERPWKSPDAFPSPPYDHIDVDEYVHPTALGARSAVYQTSIGCPYSCNFCGVIAAYGSRQRVEDPARTEMNLRFLVQQHRVDSIHFYDNNFILKEEITDELCDRITPLGLSWWCEARIDAMLRMPDRTWERLKRAGLRMVFLGAESGSDAVLKKMSKHLTTDKTVAVAEKCRSYGIIPEFSFVLGDPDDPEADVAQTLAFIRRLKAVNPVMELITYFYTPTPQRRGTYGNVDPLEGTPDTLEEWTTPEWIGWMTHEDPELSWLSRPLKARVEDFALVLKSRFPSVHDSKTKRWGKTLARVLARRRWERGAYENPWMLRAIRRAARAGDDERQEYGHLRPSRSHA